MLRDPECLFPIMRDENGRRREPGEQARQIIEQLRPRQAIQPGQWLVEQRDRGAKREGSSQVGTCASPPDSCRAGVSSRCAMRHSAATSST